MFKNLNKTQGTVLHAVLEKVHDRATLLRKIHSQARSSLDFAKAKYKRVKLGLEPAPAEPEPEKPAPAELEKPAEPDQPTAACLWPVNEVFSAGEIPLIWEGRLEALLEPFP